MPRPVYSRLCLKFFEERIVPAFDMIIDGDAATANVSSVLAGTTRTFTATSAGATLDVDDIETALNAGEDVVIRNGSGGAEPGIINWTYSGSSPDDLDYSGTALRSLSIITDATTTAAGGFLYNGPFINANDNLNVIVDQTAGTGNSNINLNGGGGFFSLNTLTLLADGDVVDDLGNSLRATNDVLILANTYTNVSGTSIASLQGDVTVNAAIDMLANLTVETNAGTIGLGAVDGAFGLTLNGGTISTGAVGATTPLDFLLLERGTATFGSIEATTVLVGSAVGPALFNSSGGVTADVFVDADGFLSPGGSNAVGTLTINGNLTFNGGSYDVNLAATPDKIIVNGDVDLTFGNLANRSMTGALTGTGNVQILSFTGTLLGEFANAPLNAGLVLGADAVNVTNYGPAATGITLAKLAANLGGIFTGSDADGTSFTVTLKGGSLTAFRGANGLLNIVANGTTPKSSLAVKTKANSSDDWVFLDQVRLNGAFGAFKGAKTFLAGDFKAAANVKSLEFLQTNGTIAVTGTIGSYTTKLGSFASLTATSMGKVSVGLDMTGGVSGWNITNGIASLAASTIGDLNLTAKFIGAVTVKPSKVFPLQPGITDSTFTLTGNDGTPKQMALKALNVAGTIDSTIFEIEEGNVGAFTVGRFVNSVLWLDYTTDGPFDTNGTFDSATAFKLESFTTTAKTLGDPNNPLNWAFDNSEIVADTIGKITLSGLKTDYNGLAGGIKFRTAGGIVRVASADDNAIPLNANLTSGVAALAGDFFFLDV